MKYLSRIPYRKWTRKKIIRGQNNNITYKEVDILMKSAKKTGNSNMTNDKSEINPAENPIGAIDQYMPLPDDVYKKWKK